MINRILTEIITKRLEQNDTSEHKLNQELSSSIRKFSSSPRTKVLLDFINERLAKLVW